MKDINELINIKFPKVGQYRQVQKSLSYVNDVLSGKHGRLEQWEIKEFENIKKEYQKIVDYYQQ